MERIIDTIEVKRALHQRLVLRYVFRAAMAGIIICLMYIFAYQIKTDLGHDFNSGLGKYLTGLSFSIALVFIYFTNSELLTSNFMYFTVGRYYNKVSWMDTMKIWALCLVGNLFGIECVAALVWSCGMLTGQKLCLVPSWQLCRRRSHYRLVLRVIKRPPPRSIKLEYPRFL